MIIYSLDPGEGNDDCYKFSKRFVLNSNTLAREEKIAITAVQNPKYS